MAGSPVRGVALGEVMLALGILAVSFFALLNLLAASPLAARRAQHEVVAGTLAQTLLEEKRTGRFSDLDVPPADMSTRIGPDGVSYTPTYQCTSEPLTDPSFTQRIKVDVEWNERGRRLRVSVEALVSNVLR